MKNKKFLISSLEKSWKSINSTRKFINLKKNKTVKSNKKKYRINLFNNLNLTKTKTKLKANTYNTLSKNLIKKIAINNSNFKEGNYFNIKETKSKYSIKKKNTVVKPLNKLKLVKLENYDIKFLSKPLYKNLFNDDNKSQIQRLRKIIIKIITLLKLKLKINKENYRYVAPKSCLELSGSSKFFEYIKLNNLDAVEEYLNRNPLYLYQYNLTKSTALHISCMRNFDEMTLLLLKYKPPVEYMDILGRKPIYFVLKNENKILLKSFFLSNAQPWSFPNKCNFYTLCNNNLIIVNSLKIMRKIHIIKMFSNYKNIGNLNNSLKKFINNIYSFGDSMNIKRLWKYFKLYVK